MLFTCKSKISPEGYHDTGTEDRMLDGKRYSGHSRMRIRKGQASAQCSMHCKN